MSTKTDTPQITQHSNGPSADEPMFAPGTPIEIYPRIEHIGMLMKERNTHPSQFEKWPVVPCSAGAGTHGFLMSDGTTRLATSLSDYEDMWVYVYGVSPPAPDTWDEINSAVCTAHRTGLHALMTAHYDKFEKGTSTYITQARWQVFVYRNVRKFFGEEEKQI